MRRQAARQRASEDEDGADTRRARLMRFVLRRPLDSFVSLIAAAAATTIVVNALFLQPGPHPAPIFAVRRPPVSSEATGSLLPVPRPRPGEAAGKSDALRSRTDLVADIQRELSKRGFYDGPVDGVYGAKTDAAVRDFEQVAGLKASTEPNEALLQAVARSSAKARPATVQTVRRTDPIANLIAPSRKIVAVQRALADFGYGQVKPTGVVDAETRAAIERFERERQLPITGQASDRVVRELASMTGRPLE